MKITVNQLRRIIKEEVQKTLNENVEALKAVVMGQLDQEYGGQDYDIQGIVDTVFREVSPQELLGMSVEDIITKKCLPLM